MADEQTYGAGEDIPGTPPQFPFGLVSNAFAAVAILSVLITIFTETNSWFPIALWGLPGLYWLAALTSLVAGTVALTRKPWRGMRSVGGILVWLFVLTPFFPVAMVLLWLGTRH